MSRPINPSSIMIYKIVREYEKTGRTIYPRNELKKYAEDVIDHANTISDEQYFIIYSENTTEDISRICNTQTSIYELDLEKYKNGGDHFAKIKIGAMPYAWLKGALKFLDLNFALGFKTVQNKQNENQL